MTPRQRTLLVVGSTLGFVFVVAIILYFTLPREARTTIAGVEWTYTVNLHQRTLARGEGWGHPHAFTTVWNHNEEAFNVQCERRFRRMVDCFCHEDCHPDCTGSGSSRHCTQHCVRKCSRCPDYDDWCNYDYYEWPVIATDSTSGLLTRPIGRLRYQPQVKHST